MDSIGFNLNFIPMPNKSNFSVVHWGPIKYTEKLWQAIAYARACVRRRGFEVDGQWHKLPDNSKLTIYRLNPEEGQNDVVTTIP
jgi:hypothetical protein